MGYISREGLKRILFNNVVEVKTELRHPKPHSNTRRFFCVGAYPNFHNNPFLATASARLTLRYRYPKGFPPYNPVPYYNPDQKNLVITWDIFRQNYRSIQVYRCNLIRVWPIDTHDNILKFWEYFTKSIAPMTSQQKEDFFDK